MVWNPGGGTVVASRTKSASGSRARAAGWLASIEQDATVDDLVAILALSRCGSHASSALDALARRYFRRRAERGTRPFLDPTLAPETKSTHGVFLYDEQVVCAIRRLSGFPSELAEALRRALLRGSPEAREFAEQRMLPQLLRSGLGEARARSVVDALAATQCAEEHKTFRKSHAAGRALLLLRAAYARARAAETYDEAYGGAGGLR